ncbi:MAG: hypothetical protein CVV64_00325 [Candidatus Wallbacteria bacterium HGW-Wallbacteria-1]|jgi:repressor LexA|uniref:LexA repressor n=1 Tax=Candidatus Wallbacteria bacterium HGW-Wallbacteria-1 TaxID=2013854 RepID=A0A2N1PUC6_9BACT|nr:MAG: hypothetical protein CVV64_00325 [Candidatus Wallbacteria bacterium HGW-Wallbacteria-1]
MRGLTKNQKLVLDFIVSFSAENGAPPSMREIMSRFSFASINSVTTYLNALEKKGFIERDNRKARRIRVLKLNESCSQGQEKSNLAKLKVISPDNISSPISGKLCRGNNFELLDLTDEPLNELPIIGTIAAGPPLLAVENIEGFLPAAASFFGGRDLFALRVRGDSLIGRSIESGDFVIIKRQNSADPGDVVAALIDDEATLKIYSPERDCIRFVPANMALSPIIIPKEEVYRITIVGKMVGVIRRVAQ